ncbi:MAG: hypothetical protein C0615_09710 [Desulfuromonas sp.]|nr:MAG: hypothetical protein C0615_09710 [Desulfuromonas sp.]
MLRNVEKFGTSDKRGRKMTHSDPFAPETGLPGVHICKSCHAVYQMKTWKSDPELYEKSLDGDHTMTVCSACQKRQEHAPEGFLTISGDYLDQHRKDILNTLQNSADEARQANPLERIIKTERADGEIMIETTTVKLAEKLGRILSRSHQGEMEISWTGEPPTCRVSWHRD